MANRPKVKTSRSLLPPKARLLFTQLATQYADATPSEWGTLRDHLEGQLGLLAGGSAERRELLVREFERVRDETLAGQWGRRVRTALASGRAELVSPARHGMEEWQVEVDAQVVRLFLPEQDDAVAGVTVARAALLGGRCPSCRIPVLVSGVVGEVAHNPLCPAKKVMAALLD